MYRSLQAYRAVAAMLVVLFHLGGTFAQDRYFGFKAIDGPFAWGDAGVDFFFVLSGFLIAHVHRRDIGVPQALGRYVAKRSLRIYPTYWLVCAAVGMAAIVFPSLRQALPDQPWIALAALTLAPLDPAVVGGTGSPILFVAWSLQYEMVFYALFAVAIVNRTLGAVVGAGLLVNALFACQGTTCAFPQSFLGSNMVFLFAFGVATAWVARSPLRVPMPRLLAFGAATLFVLFGLLETRIGHDAGGIDRRLVYGVLSSLIVLGTVRAEDAGTLAVRSRAIAILGDASYALYLVHIPIISVLVKLAVQTGARGPGALVALFGVIFAACVASAVLFHLFIERPLLAWLGRRLVGRGPRSASPAMQVASPSLDGAAREGLR